MSLWHNNSMQQGLFHSPRMRTQIFGFILRGVVLYRQSESVIQSLGISVQENNLALIMILIFSGPNVNASLNYDIKGLTALEVALMGWEFMEWDNLEIVRALVAVGADVSRKYNANLQSFPLAICENGEEWSVYSFFLRKEQT